MAQFPHFTTPSKGMLEHILEGYEGFNRPMNMMQEQQQRRQALEGQRLSNVFNQAKEPHAEELAQAEVDKARREGMFGGAGLTGELGNIQKLHMLKQQLGEDHPLVQAVQKKLNREEYSEDLLNQQRRDISAQRGFNSLPANEKALLLGKLRAAGVPEEDATKIKNGEIGLNEYLRNNGWDDKRIQELLPNQAPTTATQSAVQQVQGALAEDEYIGPKITEALGPYSTKIFGYSPEQVMQAFEQNPATLDQRARALAARALVPEIAGYRTRIAGGSEAHKALSELTHNSLNKLKVFDALVTPEEYHKAQKYIHEWQQGMGHARVRGMQGVAQKPSLSETLEKGPGAPQETFIKIAFTDKNGKKVTKKVPSKDKNAALEAGGEIIE